MGIPEWGRTQAHSIAGTLTETIARSRSGLLVGDGTETAFLEQYPDESRALASGLRSLVAVPLIRNDEPFTTLMMRSKRPNEYTRRHLALADRIGLQAAGALANSRLYEERRRAERELEEAKFAVPRCWGT